MLSDEKDSTVVCDFNDLRACPLPSKSERDKAYEELCAALDGILADLQPQIAKLLKSFRKKLTPEQNARWTNDDILAALMLADKDPTFLEGIGARDKLLNATSHDLATHEDFFTAVFGEAKLYEAIRSHAIRFWNLILSHAGQSVDRGKFMTDAPQGKGELVYFGGEKIAEIEVHRESNENGVKQRGDFVPGSGGLRVGVYGKEVPIQPILSLGTGSDVYELPDATESADNEARKLRTLWRREAQELIPDNNGRFVGDDENKNH